MNTAESDYDVVVIGSGFGGSVSALRLTEKGYRVGVLEAGKRWPLESVPKSNWDIPKWLWLPGLKLVGPQRLTMLRNTFVVSARGVGGGSLIYGCTLYDPLEKFYTDAQWAHITDWRAELAPYYDQAKRMLGSASNPQPVPSDDVLREVAEDMGVGDTYHPTEVGVFFGEPGKTVSDPYFGGVGPDRTGCLFCSDCMIGCRYGAKNTTPQNYLYLAERAGAAVHELTTVTAVRPRSDGRYDIETSKTGRWFKKDRRTFVADQVIFAAASMGTQELLHELKDRAILPDLSPRLGELTRTNNEALLNVTSRHRTDFAQGVAITSSIHPEANTHVEAVHYGKGSNTMHLLTTPLVDGAQRRALRWVGQNLRHPVVFARSLSVRHASERGFELLVMQDLDSSLTTYRKRGIFGRMTMTTKQGIGQPNPTWIPAGHEVTRRVAEKIGADPHGTVGDVFNVPFTGHFIGGCPIGDSAESGVIDAYQRIYHYPGLHVIDGAAISANLGVNPSLTITAQSERAMAFWPNNGDTDPRPELGAAYRRIKPVAPKNPAVPEAAPGALRLPLVDIK